MGKSKERTSVASTGGVSSTRRSRCACKFRDAIQPNKIRREIRSELRFDNEWLLGYRMYERHLPRVQKHPPQPFFRERLIPRKVAVLIIAGKRKAEMRKMDTYLMCAPGPQLGFQQAHWRIALRQYPPQV